VTRDGLWGSEIPDVYSDRIPPTLGGGRVTRYYQAYLAVAVFAGAALLMVGAMLGLGRLLRPTRPQEEKYFTYEAGSDPVGGWGQSNVRYYVYALLFVMFDVEAVFIFPWAVELERLGTFALVEMVIFIVVLTLALVYAWRKGVLRWA
jgi:NADH-quinone oxidoreductase subunit A